jgi:selenocysteine lyase/cysteine desulfurase
VSSELPGYDIAALRRQIPALGSMIPMCNCSQAPQTDATRAAAARYLESWRVRGMDWDVWMQEVALAKAAFASLINASPDDIAVFSSVSDAASAVASAIDFTGHRRDVLATEAEFPTIGHVWLAQEQRGAHVRWIAVKDGGIDPTEYERRVNDDTAIVSACHGYYLNGALQDISAIADVAHQNGSLVFVDAYQSAGAVPIDVKASGVDFLASGTLKYLMGIPGIAFLYVRPDRVDRLHPTVTGWFGRENPFAFEVNKLDWAPNARRFDAGTPPIMNAYIARAGMEMIAEIGVAKIRAWHELLSKRLINGAALRHLCVSAPLRRGSLKTANTAFEVKDSHAVEEAMRRKGVLASARGPVIRLAPHFYNIIDDVDTALDVLAEVTRA